MSAIQRFHCIIYLYVNGTQVCKLKGVDNIPFHCFCSGSISQDFTNDEKNEILLKGLAYDFSSNLNWFATNLI